MYDLVIFLVRLFRYIGEEMPEAFSYIPQMYLETFVEAFHSLRRADPPYDLLQGKSDSATALFPLAVLTWCKQRTLSSPEANAEGMQEVITFLITHFPDARIINPGVQLLSPFSFSCPQWMLTH
jgi:hypothetical protein